MYNFYPNHVWATVIPVHSTITRSVLVVINATNITYIFSYVKFRP